MRRSQLRTSFEESEGSTEVPESIGIRILLSKIEPKREEILIQDKSPTHEIEESGQF
jgi:hypothetical protein